MRIVRTLALPTALLAFAASTASAQIGGLGRRVSDAVERKAQQKIDKKIDEATERLVNSYFDSLFGDDTSSKSGSSSGAKKSGGSSRMFNLLPNAPTEPFYDFNTVFTYEIENIEKGKPASDKALMMMHFNSNGQYAGTRIRAEDPKEGDGEVFAIFDVKNESMVMLFDDKKDGKFSMAYSWKNAKQYIDSSAAASTSTTPAPVATTATVAAAGNPDVKFSSIGKRTIAGYSSEGYRTETPDGVMDVWVSTDPSIGYSRMMGASSSMKQVRGAMPGSHPAGMVMETLITDKRNGDKSRMTVTSIEKNAKVRVDMNDYPKIGSKK